MKNIIDLCDFTTKKIKKSIDEVRIYAKVYPCSKFYKPSEGVSDENI